MTKAVVSLEDYKQIQAKRETHTYQGQRYELVYDPKAPPGLRWLWIVRYTEVYTYQGSSDTLHKAANAARRKIRELASVR
jgi:hypothetical protein